MKTMTCKQLGGPCGHVHHGETADDVIKAQDRHLKDAVTAGDGTHRAAHEAMRARWRHPIAGMRWYRTAKNDFSALPDN
jgi:hypothetical protein